MAGTPTPTRLLGRYKGVNGGAPISVTIVNNPSDDGDPSSGNPTTGLSILLAIAAAVPGQTFKHDASPIITSVTDSKGNTYTLEQFTTFSGTGEEIGIWLYACHDAVPLRASDGDTITFSRPRSDYAYPISTYAIELAGVLFSDPRDTNSITTYSGHAADPANTPYQMATAYNPPLLNFCVAALVGGTGYVGYNSGVTPGDDALGHDYIGVGGNGGGSSPWGPGFNSDLAPYTQGYGNITVGIVAEFASNDAVIDPGVTSGFKPLNVNAHGWAMIMVGYRGEQPAATIAGESVLSADGVVINEGIATISGRGVLTATAKAEANISGRGVLTASALGAATATISGRGALFADVEPQSRIVGSGLVRALSTMLLPGQATLVGYAVFAPSVVDVIGAFYGLFDDLGLLIGRFNLFGAFAALHVDQEVTYIIDRFAARPDVEGLFAAFNRIGDDVVGWRSALAGYADQRLTDTDYVLRHLGLSTGDINTLLARLNQWLVARGHSINRTTVTVSSVTADAANQGAGTIFTTTILDGFSSPTDGAPSRDYYAGLASELAVPQQHVLVCVAEGDTGTEGNESFLWDAEPSTESLTWRREGLGSGPRVQVADAGTILQNGNFETWGEDDATNNVPSSWDIIAGTAGTSFIQEQGTGNVFRGTSSLKLVLGSASLKLSQIIANIVDPARRYHVSVRLKASSQVDTASLKFILEGPGSGGESITLDTLDMPTDWTLYSLFFNTPVYIPSVDRGDAADYTFAIRVDTTAPPGTPINVYIDSLCLTPVTYFGGIGLVIVPGADRFRIDDRFDFTVASDQAGKFQEFFRKRWKTQLPSSVSPTISDDLCN